MVVLPASTANAAWAAFNFSCQNQRDDEPLTKRFFPDSTQIKAEEKAGPQINLTADSLLDSLELKKAGNGAGNAPDRMQKSRYEYKYVISPEKAVRIHAIIQGYLVPDEYTRGKQGTGYYVHSLYLDNVNYTTWWETEQGSRNRFKLRIRFYDNEPGSPCFLEVKRRDGEIIRKTRAMVTKPAAERFCRTGEYPTEDDLIKRTPSQLEGLYNFVDHCVKLGGVKPAAFTSYLREGYEGEADNLERITFDRDLRAGVWKGKLSAADREDWPKPEMPGVVLEMKYTNEPPRWMEMVAEMAGIERTAYKKYVLCLEKTHPALIQAAPLSNP